MPKYLIEANYVGEGIKGLLKEGGSSRRAAVEKMIKSMGGKLETFYYAFGKTDVFAIVDLPDDASAASAVLTIASTGTVTIKTTPLMTPEQIDEASKKSPTYRAPGQ